MQAIKASSYYWSTTAGRRTSMFMLLGASGVAGAVHFLPHTVLKDFYIKQVAVYKDASPAPVDPDVVRRVEESFDILDSNIPTRNLVKPFTVFGLELFSIGSTISRQGLEIGIPVNYFYKSEDDIDKSNIRVNQEKVNWGTPSGEQLAESLIVPEKLQIFGICREILANSNYRLYLNTIYAMTPFLCGHFVASHINHKFDLFRRHPSIRYTFYSLITVMGYGIYMMCVDFTQCYLDKKVDEKLCTLGPDFAERGVAFYDKILKRNIAMREILGAEGQSQFTRYGDVNFLFRKETLPLTTRKKFFESKLKQPEIVENEEDSF